MTETQAAIALRRLRVDFIESNKEDSIHHARCLIALLGTIDFTEAEVDDNTMCGFAIVTRLIDILLEKTQDPD